MLIPIQKIIWFCCSNYRYVSDISKMNMEVITVCINTCTIPFGSPTVIMFVFGAFIRCLLGCATCFVKICDEIPSKK